MHAQTLSFLGRKSTEGEVVQVYKTRKQFPRGIDLERQASLGEVDLHCGHAFVETATNFSDVLVQQVLDEVFARIPRDGLLGPQRSMSKSCGTYAAPHR